MARRTTCAASIPGARAAPGGWLRDGRWCLGGTTGEQRGSLPPGLLGEMAMGARHLAACGLGLAACLLLTPASPGKYARVEVEQIPVERLVTNLETAVRKDPKSVPALVNLARVHGMVYALKTDTAQVRK